MVDNFWEILHSLRKQSGDLLCAVLRARPGSAVGEGSTGTAGLGESKGDPTLFSYSQGIVCGQAQKGRTCQPQVLMPCSQLGRWQVYIECGLCAEPRAHSLGD